MNRVRVLLADDHAVLRAGLRLLIDAEPDMTVVGEAGDGPGAVKKSRAIRPDIVILDLSMPNTDAESTIRQLTRLGIHTVVLTMHDDAAYLTAARAAGAQGYVAKRAADVELLAAIRAVKGGHPFPKGTPSRPAPRPGPSPRLLSRLSAREIQVLRLVGYGFTNREIAAQLGLGTKTVETFRGRVCEKFDLHSRADLVRFAFRLRLVDVNEQRTAVVPTPPPRSRARS